MFLEINWDNIKTEMQHNYNKYPRTAAYPKYKYNLLSMMHYSLGSSSNRPAMALNTVRKLNKFQILILRHFVTAFL